MSNKHCVPGTLTDQFGAPLRSCFSHAWPQWDKSCRTCVTWHTAINRFWSDQDRVARESVAVLESAPVATVHYLPGSSSLSTEAPAPHLNLVSASRSPLGAA